MKTKKQIKNFKGEKMRKINPEKDTLKSALIKTGINQKMTKAILSGYEGINLSKPLSAIFLS